MNNWLAGSRLPYEGIILFIYSWAYQLTSIKYCKRGLGINKNTMVDWSNYMTEVYLLKLLKNPVVIGGPGMHVEIYEALFTKRKVLLYNSPSITVKNVTKNNSPSTHFL